MADETTPTSPGTPPAEPSPTGTPVLPPNVVRYVAPCIAVAAAITMGPEAGIVLPAVVLTVAKLVVLVGTVLGVVSPGWRKPGA